MQPADVHSLPYPDYGPDVPGVEGLIRIRGARHNLLVDLRAGRVARFRNLRGTSWNVPAPAMLLTSSCALQPNGELNLRWTFRDVTNDGRDAIRQDYVFGGRFQPDGTALGVLAIRIVADFLVPTVVLADVRGPALLCRLDEQLETSAA